MSSVSFSVSSPKHPTFLLSQTSEALLDSLLAAKSSCRIPWPAEYFSCHVRFFLHFSIFPLISGCSASRVQQAGPRSGRFAEGPRRASRRTISPKVTPFIFFSDHRSSISSCLEEIRHAETSFSCGFSRQTCVTASTHGCMCFRIVFSFSLWSLEMAGVSNACALRSQRMAACHHALLLLHERATSTSSLYIRPCTSSMKPPNPDHARNGVRFTKSLDTLMSW